MPFRLFVGTLMCVAAFMLAPLAVVLAQKWPLSTDFIFYATILKEFSAQFWDGEFYPRWLADANGGLGSPVFLFYPPLAFYAATPFQWLAEFDQHGFGRVLLSMYLALVVMGITSYRWLSRHVDRAVAQKGALLYVGFPYLVVLMYFAFPPAQLWALAIYPFLLEAAYDLAVRKPRAVLKLSVGYALLFLTHIPAAIVMSPVPLLYAVFFSSGARTGTIKHGLFSLTLGVALAAIYFLPAIANQPYINSGRFISGAFSYSDNFSHLQSLIGLALIIIPLFILYLALPTKRKALTPLTTFSLAVIAALLFMISPLSSPVWNLLPPLAYLQFPYRFFLGAIPLAVLVACRWSLLLKQQHMMWLAAFWLSLSVWAFVTSNSAVTLFTEDKTQLRAHDADILGSDIIVASEYQTLWQSELDKAMLSQPPVRLGQGKGVAESIDWQPRRIILSADIHSATARLIVRRFYFPGWQTLEEIMAEPYRGLISVTLPKGKHDVVLAMPYFAGEKLGLQVSAAAIMVWLTLYAFSYKKIRV